MLVRKAGQAGGIAAAGFAAYVFPVGSYGVNGNIQHGGYLRVGFARGDKAKHIQLPEGESVLPVKV